MTDLIHGRCPLCGQESDKCKCALISPVRADYIPAVMAIPKGWQLAPKEPTDKMYEAGLAQLRAKNSLRTTYQAMLAAAPPAPSEKE